MSSSHQAIFLELERLTCREMRSSARLVELVLEKVNLLDRSQFADEQCERLARTFLELIKDVLADRYQDLSIRAFAHICVALDYFLDPVETLPGAKPDAELGGFTDDLRFLVQTHSRFEREIDRYLTWKQSRDSQP
jgi:hypothetical protein